LQRYGFQPVNMAANESAAGLGVMLALLFDRPLPVGVAVCQRYRP
jgi:hypothetical protein